VGPILPPRSTNGELTLLFGRSEQIGFEAKIDRLDGKIGFEEHGHMPMIVGLGASQNGNEYPAFSAIKYPKTTTYFGK
jgi:hypothetical protein